MTSTLWFVLQSTFLSWDSISTSKTSLDFQTTQLQGKETLYDLQCSESSGLNASRGAVKWNTSERICHTCFDGGTRSHISLTLSQF